MKENHQIEIVDLQDGKYSLFARLGDGGVFTFYRAWKTVNGIKKFISKSHFKDAHIVKGAHLIK